MQTPRYGLTLAIITALFGGPLASAAASENVNSFAGSCSVQGTDTFTPPASNTPRALTVVYDAAGSCTGVLNGRSVSNAPIRIHSLEHSYGSCGQAHTTAPGNGAIVFSNGTTIAYTVEFTSTLTEVSLTFRGQRSGTATGHATFLTARTPPNLLLECAGSGASQVPMDLSLSTQSPLASDEPSKPHERQQRHRHKHQRRRHSRHTRADAALARR